MTNKSKESHEEENHEDVSNEEMTRRNMNAGGHAERGVNQDEKERA